MQVDAEYLAKLIGQVDTEAIKRDPKTDTQHELFSSLPEQWEQWIDRLRFQPARQVTVADLNGHVRSLRTITIPSYTATDEQVRVIQKGSASHYGIPYSEAERNVQETLLGYEGGSSKQEISAYETVTVVR